MQHKKYFGTDGIRGKVGGLRINPETVVKLGHAVGKVLVARHGKSSVLVGKDTRISGYMLESALEAGLSSAGVDIKLLGPMPTPAIAYLTKTLRSQAGVVISASHNPFYDNGIKFFNANGRKLSDEMEFDIEKAIDAPIQTVESSLLGKAMRVVDAPGRYIEFCKSTFPSNLSLKGMKIVIDCANGATYHVAPDVFKELGAEVITIATSPNGLNINEESGATFPENLCKHVTDNQADLGIALDGDGDRVVMVDKHGSILDGDDILFITANYYKEIDALYGGVVGTVMSNIGLEKYFVNVGIPFSRSGVGDRLVISELDEKKWQLGGEPSGHIVNYKFNETGDGVIAALQILAAMLYSQKELHELVSGYEKYPSVLKNIEIENGKKLLADKEIQSAINACKKDVGENIRILVRASGTESIVRVMVEGKDQAQINQVVSSIESIIYQYTS